MSVKFDGAVLSRHLAETFFHPLTPERFRYDIWKQRVEVIRGSADKLQTLFGGPFGFDRFRTLLKHAASSRVVNKPLLYFFEDGGYRSIEISFQDAADFLDQRSPNLVGIDTLERIDADLFQLCEALRESLAVRGVVGTKFFFHPQESTGICYHVDAVCTLQILMTGTRRWRISREPVTTHIERVPDLRVEGDELIFENRLGETSRRNMSEIEMLEFDVGPGDIVYIPAGHLHDATTTSEGSLGMTIALSHVNFVDVFHKGLENWVVSQPSWRAAFPDSEDEIAEFIQSRFEELQRVLNDRGFWRAQLAEVSTTPISIDFAVVDSAEPEKEIDRDSILRRRLGARWDLIDEGDRVVVFAGDIELTFDEPTHMEFARRIAKCSSFVAEDALQWTAEKPLDWDEIAPFLQQLVEHNELVFVEK